MGHHPALSPTRLSGPLLYRLGTLEIVSALHFVPTEQGSQLVGLDERNQSADTSFIEGHSASFAAYAHQQVGVAGRGCVHLPMERLEERERLGKSISGPVTPDDLGIWYLSESDFPHPDTSGVDLPDDIGVARDQLAFALRVLIHQYEPQSEYLVLLTQDGVLLRLYRIKPETVRPEELRYHGPESFN